MAVLTGKKAPSFKASAVTNGGTVVNDFSLDQFLGKILRLSLILGEF